MIARLVENAGREVHALDLASDPAAGVGREAIDLGDAGEILDAKARAAYKERIQELREELEETERFADTSRKERLQRELDALTQQLAAAVGLGGRERRTGSAAERARITVSRRVREAIKKIAEHDPELGRHFDWTIRTGTFSAYEPAGRKTNRCSRRSSGRTAHEPMRHGRGPEHRSGRSSRLVFERSNTAKTNENSRNQESRDEHRRSEAG